MEKSVTTQKSTSLAYLSRFMSSLFEDQSKLREIQTVYDNLTLLGQLLCAGTDITSMRKDFNDLAETLINQLALELRKKAVLSLSSNARVAIDILIRNLFERTADIGFLCTDTDIRAYAESVIAQNDYETDNNLELIINRFDEYVRKYSVYHNIILLSPEGKVLAQLDKSNLVTSSTDPLIVNTLNTDQAYVETFRATDLLPDQKSPLIYSYRVMSQDNKQVVGILCLCFKFQDECERIFSNLITHDDWTVITLLDQKGYVIASSDEYQFPIGAKLETVLDDECKIVRFAEREYLATTQLSSGYQGYMGPGWLGHALSPLNHVFEMAAAHELAGINEKLLKCVMQTSSLFTEELRYIPVKATTIQHELNRAVWNGNLGLSRNSYEVNATFAKVLLWEIRSTGVRTRNVFSDSTNNLYQTVISSVLYDCGTQAALAIEIMDRNLYERANDCRWWALNSIFRTALANKDTATDNQQILTDILRTINGLYTVYSNLLIFDHHGQVLAVSNPAYTDLVGEKLQGEWIRQTLGLADTQNYCVSTFTASTLYDDQPSYIYSAAIRQPRGNDPIGGIAIVFDSRPQFQAMLNEALPRGEDGTLIDGAFAVYTERNGRIIASTHSDYQVGQLLQIGREFYELDHAAHHTNIISLDGRYYAVGSCMSAGYREYKGANDNYRNDVVALVLSPLSDTVIDYQQADVIETNLSDSNYQRQLGEDTVEIATFYVGKAWYGIRSNLILESIDIENIAKIPGVPQFVRGCLIFGDHSITIFDLNGLLHGEYIPSESKQAIIVTVPDSEIRYGILIDDLGEIPAIATSRIEPITTLISTLSIAEGLVKPLTESADEAILVILSTEHLLLSLSSSSPTNEQQTTE